MTDKLDRLTASVVAYRPERVSLDLSKLVRVTSREAPKKWTADEFNRMAEVGLLQPSDRVELIEGEIIRMTPQNKPHGLIVSHLTQLLVERFGRRFYVRVQLPLSLFDHSEPEPDFALCEREATLAADRHPTTAFLVVEVSESSLDFDRQEKSRLYAQAGVPDYWIINISDRVVECFSQPRQERYELLAVKRGDDLLTLGVSSAELRAEDCFPFD